jgi:hypothetical protein
MKKAGLVLAFLAACACAAFGTDPAYELDASVDPERGTISAEVSVTLPAGHADHAFLRVLANTGEKPNPRLFPFYEQGTGPDGFSPAWARVTELTVNGQARPVAYQKAPAYTSTYNLERVLVRVDLTGVEAGIPAVVSFHYEVQLPHRRTVDDFHFGDRLVSRFGWFPYVASEDRLGALVLEPFTYAARVKPAPGWLMARVGTSFREDAAGAVFASETPVCSVPLFLCRGFKRYSVDWNRGAKTLDILYQPTAEDGARLVSAYAREALEHYAERYLPYEARYVTVAQDDIGAFGMAADSLVLLGDGIFGGLNRLVPGLSARPLEYVVDHEMGHLYWGIGEPMDFMAENWLSEGINEYSTLEWFEQKYGRWDNRYAPQQDVAARWLTAYSALQAGHSYASSKLFSVLSNHDHGWDEPLSAPADRKIANAASSIDYDRSWFVLSMLARSVGRDRFRQVLTDLARERRYRVLTAKDLAAFVSERTGTDVTAFFDAFVFGTKTVDYELEGTLNVRTGDGYESRLTVRDRQDSGIFIPTAVTLFLGDGTEQTVDVNAPGAVTARTVLPVLRAGVDADAENLDLDRKNNFWPRAVLLGFGGDHRVLDGACDRVYPDLLPYLEMDAAAGTTDLGWGLVFSDMRGYSATLSAFATLPSALVDAAEPAATPAFAAGLDFTGTLRLQRDASVSISGLYRSADALSSAAISARKVLYLPLDVGSTATYLSPVLTLSGSASVKGLSLAAAGSAYGSFAQGAALDTMPRTGTYATLANETVWRWSAALAEDRVTLDVTQAIPFLPMTLLGVQATASAGFGALDALNGTNAVLGFGSTIAGSAAFDASAQVFLAVPLLNHLDTLILNCTVLQSVNLAFVYKAAAALNGPADASVQQAAAIELMPYARTIEDASGGLALGMSWNVTAIAAAPTSPGSWAPRFFVDVSVLPALFNSVTPY